MLVLFTAFPAPITVLSTKYVPVNSHSMNKDGGLVLQFQLKMKKKKKKNQTADRCSWERQFWLKYPESAVGKALSVFFGSLNTQNILKGTEITERKEAAFVYIFIQFEILVILFSSSPNLGCYSCLMPKGL